MTLTVRSTSEPVRLRFWWERAGLAWNELTPEPGFMPFPVPGVRLLLLALLPRRCWCSDPVVLEFGVGRLDWPSPEVPDRSLVLLLPVSMMSG